MNISEIRVMKVENHSILKAYVNITFNHALSIKGMRIIQGKERMYVSMPSVCINGKYINKAFPIHQKVREEMERNVLSVYEELLDNNLYTLTKSFETDNELMVSQISIKKLSCDNCIRGVVNLVINNEFALMDIILMNKDDHYFIGMPSKKVDNDFYEYFHPINSKARNQLEHLITSLYSNMTSNELRTINVNNSYFFDNHLELAYQEKMIV